jgi:hypothetical protein
MRLVSRLFLFCISIHLGAYPQAFARLPEKPAEHSLLYWRYLCHGERQVESVQQNTREFKCPSQGWLVRTPASSGVVKEIIDDTP